MLIFRRSIPAISPGASHVGEHIAGELSDRDPCGRVRHGCGRRRRRAIRKQSSSAVARAVRKVSWSRQAGGRSAPGRGGRSSPGRRLRSGRHPDEAAGEFAHSGGAARERAQDAARRQALREADRRPRGVGEDGSRVAGCPRSRSIRRPQDASTGQPAGGLHGPGEIALGLSARASGPAADGEERGLGRVANRPLRVGQARGGRPDLAAARRRGHADPPRHVRPDRPAADAGGGRGVRDGQLSAGLRAARESAARLAALRRALGPALARRGPLRRDRRRTTPTA